MIEKFLANKLLHVILLIVFYILLAIEYAFFVCEFYTTAGFSLEYSFLTITIGSIFLLINLFRLFFTTYHSSQIYAINIFISLFFCIPAIIMYQLGGISIFIPLYALLFLFLLSSPLLIVPHFSFQFNIKNKDIVLIISALILLIPLVLSYGFKLNFNVFSFGSEIYDIRASAKSQSNVFTAYLFGPITKVLFPIIMVIGLIKKKKLLYISAILLMLYIFMMNPHKSLFLSIFLVILFYFFSNYRAKAGIMVLGITTLVFLTILVTNFTGNLLPESIFVRRMFFIPVQICDNYFTFYQESPIYLSHSVFSSFVDYPYYLEPAYMMGELMYNKPATSCNTGIIADGFMNFGHFGCVLYIFLATLIINFLVSLNMHYSFFGVVILFIFLFMNSALLTSLLTHGGIFFCLVAILFLKDTQDNFSINSLKSNIL